MLKQMDDMSLKEDLAALYASVLSEGEVEGLMSFMSRKGYFTVTL